MHRERPGEFDANRAETFIGHCGQDRRGSALYSCTTRAAAHRKIRPGGLFAAMGVTCLLLQSDLIFWAIGIAWLGAALGRIWSLVIDRNFDRMKLRGIVMESAIAVPLMAPTLWIQ